MSQRPVPIRPANLDVARQVQALSFLRKKDLESFLVDLQLNPYTPKIMKNCEVLAEERFRYALPSGCVVTWKVESLHVEGTPHLFAPRDYLRIILLDVAH